MEVKENINNSLQGDETNSTFSLHMSMALPTIWYSYIGTILQTVVGIPVSLRLNWLPGTVELGVSVLRLLCATVLALCASGNSAFNVSTGKNTAKQYFSVLSFLVTCINLLIILRLIASYKKLNETEGEWNRLEKVLRRHRRSWKWNAFDFLLAGITVANMWLLVNHSLVMARNLLSFVEQSFPSHPLLALCIVAVLLCAPVCMMSHGIIYILTISYMLQYSYLRDVTHSVLTERRAEDVNTVLPVVEVDQSVIFLGPSTHRCSPRYSRILHGRNMIRTYAQVKNIRLQRDRLWSLPFSVKIVNFACYASVVLVLLLEPQGQIAKRYEPFGGIYMQILWTLAIFAPTIFSQSHKHRASSTAVEICMEMFSSSDPEMRKVFERLVHITQDCYSDHVWVFFELDYSLMSVILDVAVLMATTFVVVQGN